MTAAELRALAAEWDAEAKPERKAAADYERRGQPSAWIWVRVNTLEGCSAQLRTLADKMEADHDRK
jgi:hypothetical protein